MHIVAIIENTPQYAVACQSALLQGKSALWSHLFAFHVTDQRNRANMQQSSADSDHQTSGKYVSAFILTAVFVVNLS